MDHENGNQNNEKIILFVELKSILNLHSNSQIWYYIYIFFFIRKSLYL